MDTKTLTLLASLLAILETAPHAADPRASTVQLAQALAVFVAPEVAPVAVVAEAPAVEADPAVAAAAGGAASWVRSLLAPLTNPTPAA